MSDIKNLFVSAFSGRDPIEIAGEALGALAVLALPVALLFFAHVSGL